MKCEDCQRVLEEYFDSELQEREAIEVRAHLMNCEACTSALASLADEQNVYALYERDVEVSPALWAGISARIREEERARQGSLIGRWRRQLAQAFATPRLSPALTFALLVLSVGATAGVMKYMQSRPDSTQTVATKQPEKLQPAPPTVIERAVDSKDGKEEEAVEGESEQFAQGNERNEDKAAPAYRIADRFEGKRAAVTDTVRFPYEESPEQLVREAEQKYRAAITLLARDAKRRRTLLEPDVRERFDQTLAAVDRTINETRTAARRQPDDPVAVQYMLAAYAKKVEVLREMATYRAYDRDIQ
ncbi:MAG TPA: zf-HC2 domain-containing protein [Pyrinomonadaceae bacterium]|nr:zf-HC2 domain-containing protein [Pyrinomonadaceae bacterium]